MPHVIAISASGSAQRRLAERTMKDLATRGYTDVRRQEGGSWVELLSENMGGGLFDERSVIVIEEAEKLGEMPERCGDMLEGPDAAVVIVLICRPGRAKSDDDDDAGGKGGLPIPKALLPKCIVLKAAGDPPPWSRERDEAVAEAARDAGAGVDAAAVSLLKEMFEDMSELASETEKVATACVTEGRTRITVGDVESLCMSDGARGLLRFLDSLCAVRPLDVMIALADLRRGSELLPLLSALHNRLRLAYYAAAYPKERSAFFRALGARDYAARQAEAAARSYGRAALHRAVCAVIEINANEKSGRGAGWSDLEIAATELLASASAR